MRLAAVLAALAILAGSCSDDGGVAAGGDEPDTTIVATPTSVTTPPTSTSATEPPGELPITLCEDIAEPVPSVIGTLPGGQNPPWELDGVLITYAAEHPDTYAGRWIARDHGGTLVMAFTDDPAPHLAEILARRPMETDVAAIEPRPPITATWTVAESGYAVDVVQLAHSEAELDAVRDGLVDLVGRDDLTLDGFGQITTLNRIFLSLRRPTRADVELLATLVPVDMVCVEGPLWDESMAPPSVDEPLTIMADAGDDPLVTCGSGPFPLSALDGPPDVDPDTDDPAEIVLLAGGMEGLGVPQTGWRTLWRTDDEALFGNFEGTYEDPFVSTSIPGTDTRVGVLLHTLRNTPAGWTLSGTSGGCRLRLAVPDGVGITSVGLDPANPIDPGSSTLHLLVRERDCSGAADPTERLRPPEVIETATEVRIAVAVVPPEGDQTCPGNPSVPITIELAEPLGDRSLLDGVSVPPQPLGDLGL